MKYFETDRTNFEIYPSSKIALEAAKQEATRTGIPQYFVRHPMGWIVTPVEPEDPTKTPVVPELINMKGTGRPG